MDNMVRGALCVPVLARCLVVQCVLATVVSGIRENVVVTGTEMAPAGYKRVSGKAMAKCPATHPIAFDHGHACCSYTYRVNNPALNERCDGKRMKWTDPLVCCHEGYGIPCPEQDPQLCNHLKDRICHLKSPPHVHPSSDPPYDTSGRFDVSRIFTNIQCEVTNQNYWLPNNWGQPAAFILDLGCNVEIYTFYLRNTHGGSFNDRGTADFTIEASSDLSTWMVVVDGTLPSAIGLGCNTPLLKFTPTPIFYGSYIRFTAISKYSNGPGLHHMKWTYYIVP